MIQQASKDYKIPELEEVHQRNLRELFITQDARSENYLDKMISVDMTMIRITYLIKSYIQNSLIRLVTGKA